MDDEVGVMNQLKFNNLISYTKLACFPYIAKNLYLIQTWQQLRAITVSKKFDAPRDNHIRYVYMILNIISTE